MLSCKSFFNTEKFPHNALFPEDAYVWEPLNNLSDYLSSYNFPGLFFGSLAEGQPLARTLILHGDNLFEADDFRIVFGNTNKGELAVYHGEEQLFGASVLMAGASFIGAKIDIGKGVLIESGAMVKGPTIIGDCTEVRQGAYLRGSIICGRACVLGHTTEIKHAIFLNNAKAGHFNYIGDSILGNDTNLGAGTKFANLRFIGGNIRIHDGNTNIDTGRKKFGAILGDESQTGCNSVTSPGTILGKGSFVLPNTTVKSGYHRPGSLLKPAAK